jgi:starch-binding outer membrane protein SusE/F
MRISFLYILMIGIFAMLSSCKKDETKVTVNEIVAANTLKPLTSSSFVLTLDNATDTFQIFKWNAPDYGFAAAIKYTLQMDKQGNNFASALTLATVTQSDSAIIIASDLNKIMLSNGYDPETESAMEFRVTSWINDSVSIVYSNVVKANITPYATSFPPIYMCGAATGGWNWGASVAVRSSAPNVYGTIAYFITNNTFRFFKAQDWGAVQYNYPYFTGTVSNLFSNANDGDKNLLFSGPTGYYQISVNLKTKSVGMTAVDEPVMYMTGDALGGWDWTTHFVKMTWVSDMVFKATANFINGGAFRFFDTAGWSTSHNFNDFTTIPAVFVNAGASDYNFKFVGTTGTYTITMNMITKTVTME